MKYFVRVQNDIYEVEIADLVARPIVTFVNGVMVEVWPESETSATRQETKNVSNLPELSNKPSIQSMPSDPSMVHSPLPGVVISIAVKPGDDVEVGQELCVLEAMKMKNTIRSSHSGVISEIDISVGQTVAHNDVLMKFNK
jgi:biotin carboxyl carrier protein